MKELENYNEEKRNRWEERAQRHKDGRIWTGLFLLLVGAIALARSFGVPMPVWLFSWQMLLITIGLFTGFRKGFRDGGWFIPIIIGGAFLMNDYVLHGELRRHIWPLVLIVVGIFFIFRPRRSKQWDWKCNEKKNTGMNAAITTPANEENFSQDDFIEITSVFGGTEKIILSKNFKGGSMVNIFGGSEINLTQADLTGTAVLDVTNIFGGATLVVPPHWAVTSEAFTIFGGISDKRSVSGFAEKGGKTLIIKGTVIFGGLEIKSF